MKKRFKEQIIKILKEDDSETSLTEVYCKQESVQFLIIDGKQNLVNGCFRSSTMKKSLSSKR